MRTLNIALLLTLCTGLSVSSARAEELAVPAREKRQGMSYEEYSGYREKMRQRMENRQTPGPAQKPAATAPAKTGKTHHESAYGQGYSTRQQAVDREDIPERSRPERPAGGFSRDGMGRR